MNLHPLAIAMHEILATRIPSSVPDSEVDAARTQRATNSFDLANAVSGAERAAASASIEEFLEGSFRGDEINRTLLGDVLCLLDGRRVPNFEPRPFAADSDNCEGEMAKPLEAIGFRFKLAAGHGVAPTSFLRVGAFTSRLEGVQIFDVLGMPGVKVERGARPLKESHLMVLIYLLSRVKNYDGRLGACVAFNPWDCVRGLGWSLSTQSLERLVDACDDLQEATLRIAHGDIFDSKTAASLISSHTSSLDNHKRNWTVVLPAALLNALQDYRTFVRFETLSALPRGAARMVYCFLRSEKASESTWDEDAFAAMVGLTSQDPAQRRRKLREALEVLQSGVHTVKPRGEAINAVGRCEIVETKQGIKLRSIGESVTKTFDPVVATFSFKKDRDGTRRVTITKA